MDEQIRPRLFTEDEAAAYRKQYRDSTQQATGRFLHFTSPEQWDRHQQQVVEAKQ
jgi:hypothetical protein